MPRSSGARSITASFGQRLATATVLAVVGTTLYANTPAFLGASASGPAALASALVQTFTIAYVAVCTAAVSAHLARWLCRPAPERGTQLQAARSPAASETSSTAS